MKRKGKKINEKGKKETGMSESDVLIKQAKTQIKINKSLLQVLGEAKRGSSKPGSKRHDSKKTTTSLVKKHNHLTSDSNTKREQTPTPPKQESSDKTNGKQAVQYIIMQNGKTSDTIQCIQNGKLTDILGSFKDQPLMYVNTVKKQTVKLTCTNFGQLMHRCNTTTETVKTITETAENGQLQHVTNLISTSEKSNDTGLSTKTTNGKSKSSVLPGTKMSYRTPSANCRNKSGHIKRPMNAFMVWARTYRGHLAKTMLNATNADISIRLGEVWNEMTANEKQPFYSEADKIKNQHRIDFPDWVYRPQPSKRRQDDILNHNLLWARFNGTSSSATLARIATEAATHPARTKTEIITPPPNKIIVSTKSRPLQIIQSQNGVISSKPCTQALTYYSGPIENILENKPRVTFSLPQNPPETKHKTITMTKMIPTSVIIKNNKKLDEIAKYAPIGYAEPSTQAKCEIKEEYHFSQSTENEASGETWSFDFPASEYGPFEQLSLSSFPKDNIIFHGVDERELHPVDSNDPLYYDYDYSYPEKVTEELNLNVSGWRNFLAATDSNTKLEEQMKIMFESNNCCQGTDCRQCSSDITIIPVSQTLDHCKQKHQETIDLLRQSNSVLESTAVTFNKEKLSSDIRIPSPKSLTNSISSLGVQSDNNYAQITCNPVSDVFNNKAPQAIFLNTQETSSIDPCCIEVAEFIDVGTTILDHEKEHLNGMSCTGQQFLESNQVSVIRSTRSDSHSCSNAEWGLSPTGSLPPESDMPWSPIDIKPTNFELRQMEKGMQPSPVIIERCDKNVAESVFVDEDTNVYLYCECEEQIVTTTDNSCASNESTEMERKNDNLFTSGSASNLFKDRESVVHNREPDCRPSKILRNLLH